MLGHEFESVPTVKTRTRGGLVHISASPRFDGAGGVSIILDVPQQPPRTHSSEGESPTLVTVKIWSRAGQKLEPVEAFGAPDVTRTEEAPFTEHYPGAGYDTRHAPPYYGITAKVFMDGVEVDQCCAGFSLPAGVLVRDYSG